MNDNSKSAFWEKRNESFSAPHASQDLLHPEASATVPGYQLTETQYFGFNIPEHGIHALCYVWLHPHLKTVTGGAYVWQGVKTHNFDCELFDFVTYMHSDEVFKNDLWDYQLENSYHVQTIEPLKKHRIRYDDPQRQNHFDVNFEAIMAPMVMSTGLHIEQAMRATGSLTLRGKRYDIPGTYTVRDRSWGALRSEKHVNCPPLAWMTGIVDESFIFGCTAFDTPETSPDSYPGLAVPGGQNVKGGWVSQNGELVPVLAARKTTWRNPLTLIPERVEMEMTDALGRHYAITGSVIAAAGWRTWHNFETFICLVRWEYAGKVFYGDLQECHWAEFVRQARAANRT